MKLRKREKDEREQVSNYSMDKICRYVMWKSAFLRALLSHSISRGSNFDWPIAHQYSLVHEILFSACPFPNLSTNFRIDGKFVFVCKQI